MDKSLPLIIRNAQVLARTEPSLKDLLKKTMKDLSGMDCPQKKIKLIHHLIRENLEGLKQANCKAGCAHCCHHLISLSKDEGELLSSTSNTINKSRLIKQLNNTESNYNDSACVLLKDGKCTNYENRPLICRLTYVSTDPINCHKENTTIGIKHLAVSRAAIIAGAYYMLNSELMTLPESFKSSQ